MAKTYTTFTATSTVAITYSYTCSKCGKGVTQAGKVITSASSGPIRGGYSSVSGFNTNPLQQQASAAMPGRIAYLKKATAALAYAANEPDPKARWKTVKKNRSNVLVRDKCPYCHAAQGWGPNLNLMPGLFGTLAGLCVIGSLPVMAATEGSVIPLIVSVLALAGCIFWARKRSLGAMKRYKATCAPTVFIHGLPI